MLNVIKLKGVTSYSSTELTTLGPLKRINLLYGINGTGKSTISGYLQDINNQNYQSCSITPTTTQDNIFVYNQIFVERNFYQQLTQPGIFSINRDNIQAKLTIEKLNEELETLRENEKNNRILKESLRNELKELRKQSENNIWNIKISCPSELSYCFEGFNSSKQKFFDKVLQTQLIQTNIRTFEELSSNLKELNNLTQSEIIPNLSPITFLGEQTEQHTIFGEIISASEDSYLSTLITKLGNSDWIKNGLGFLNQSAGQCPLCQQTLPDDFVTNIKILFDKTYEEKISQIQMLRDSYQKESESLMNVLNEDVYKQIALTKNEEFNHYKTELKRCLEQNLSNIQQKISSPTKPIKLTSSSGFITTINKFIAEQKQKIIEQNNRIKEKNRLINEIKNEVWQQVRKISNPQIELYDKENKTIELKLADLSKNAKSLQEKLGEKEKNISDHRSQITNIQDSINNINLSLKSIGLIDFEIQKTNSNENDTDYSLVRLNLNQKENIFKSLSEGEKTLITFLYFLEVCNGQVKSNSSLNINSRIIVIDDPISSLSHNYIYEIAQLIHDKIFSKKFSQVFVLTHSLYFFHELLKNRDYDNKKKNENYAYFRLTKEKYSTLHILKPEDIKNDYQAFWQVIKDTKQNSIYNPILPNTMRNILEYYFSFICKKDNLKKVLYAMENNDSYNSSIKAFYRYINRESHRDAINILDSGEIDINNILSKFKIIFDETGHIEHYNLMMDEIDVTN